jgi:hypothetical protein
MLQMGASMADVISDLNANLKIKNPTSCVLNFKNQLVEIQVICVSGLVI